MIDLEVMIDNPGPAVKVTQLNIQIPVGETGGNSGAGNSGGNILSGVANLPAPACDPFTTAHWDITASASLVTLKPRTDDAGLITNTIRFTLPGIKVNEAEGVVPITITEMQTSGKTIDGVTYTLEKLEADFPILRFYAGQTDESGNVKELKPPVLYDFDQTVTLYWECSEQGKLPDYSYSLRTTTGDNWQPKDCLNDADCFSFADGVSGILSARLKETTTFALDVIRTNQQGRALYKSLSLKVRVAVPRMLADSYYQDLYFSGHIARLHWIAENANSCVVKIEGRPVDDSAPTDTYLQGYTLSLPQAPGKYAVSITPQGEFVTPPHSLNAEIEVRAADVLHFNSPTLKNIDEGALDGVSASQIAVTADSTLAFVGFVYDLLVIDLVTHQQRAELTQTIYNGLSDVAISASNVGVTNRGILAVFDIHQPQTARNLNLPPIARVTNAIGVEEDIYPYGFTLTPDGKYMLAFAESFFWDLTALKRRMTGYIQVIELANPDAVVTTISLDAEPMPLNLKPEPPVLGVTTDSKHALMCLSDNNCWIIDLETYKCRPDPIPLGSVASAIALTPNGLLALVACAKGITVIDLQTWQPEPPINVGFSPATDAEFAASEVIAITPDSKLALVGSPDCDSITVVDINARRALSKTFFINPQGVCAIAVTPDSKLTLVADGSNNVTIFESDVFLGSKSQQKVS